MSFRSQWGEEQHYICNFMKLTAFLCIVTVHIKSCKLCLVKELHFLTQLSYLLQIQSLDKMTKDNYYALQIRVPVLCSSTSIRVCMHPEAGRTTFVSRFQPFSAFFYLFFIFPHKNEEKYTHTQHFS